MGYVEGRIQAPSTMDPSYDQWKITNSLIMGWLIHSMVLEIGEGYLAMDTTEDIREGEMTVLQYFTFLSNGWKRLYHLQDYKPVYSMDSAGYRKFVEQVRVFKFLEALSVEYDLVRSRVLGMDMLHSLQEAFPYVQNEENRRSAMLASPTTDHFTLVFAAPEMKSV
ncbi:uncharacterized protein LOC114301437 [Camellia sinensis]|uniref:uncharacterized protein LOC114301437 n=1 Tax=Camellia sinensis TaxID=4442 RepID=UPI00103561F0|nr:uncharacterized protein LOC114301437 [Camellia sinensis]